MMVSLFSYSMESPVAWEGRLVFLLFRDRAPPTFRKTSEVSRVWSRYSYSYIGNGGLHLLLARQPIVVGRIIHAGRSRVTGAHFCADFINLLPKLRIQKWASGLWNSEFGIHLLRFQSKFYITPWAARLYIRCPNVADVASTRKLFEGCFMFKRITYVYLILGNQWQI